MNRTFAFESARGKVPFADFMKKLDARNEKTTIRNITRKVDALDVQGSRVVAEHLREGVWQVTVGDYRILFFPWRDKYILSHGFRKKSNETPDNEINRVKRHKGEWVQIHGQG